MPDLIPDKYGIFDRHPVPIWIPAFAGMTILRYLISGVIPFTLCFYHLGREGISPWKKEQKDQDSLGI
jgi:hypothetical protein